jgi:hypothetical protein
MSIVKADVCVKTQCYFKLMYHAVLMCVPQLLQGYVITNRKLPMAPSLITVGCRIQHLLLYVVISMTKRNVREILYIYIKRSYSKALSTPGK